MIEQLRFPQAIQQQIALLNARITNINISISDLLRDMDATLRAYAAKVAELEKENAELKASQSKDIQQSPRKDN